jgi:predicted  nucleic acid-binding Zn-ribbon protein
VKNRNGEALALLNLARLSRQQGNLNTSLQQIEAAIAILETTRSEIRSTELRTAYFASVQDYYSFYTNLLMQLHKQNPSQGYNQKALQASERSRARGLLDLLNEARVDIRQGADPKLLEQERSLITQLRALETRRVTLSSNNALANQVRQLDQELNTLQTQYQQNQDQIRATSPRYAALTQPKPFSLREIQALLDDNTVLLQYSLGERHSYCLGN